MAKYSSIIEHDRVIASDRFIPIGARPQINPYLENPPRPEPAPPPKPVPDFTYSPSTGESPISITFINRTEGTTTEYVWDFGDGTIINTTSSSVIIHEYSSVGTYTVSLTATNSTGSNTEIKANIIDVTTANVPTNLELVEVDSVSYTAAQDGMRSFATVNDIAIIGSNDGLVTLRVEQTGTITKLEEYTGTGVMDAMLMHKGFLIISSLSDNSIKSYSVSSNGVLSLLDTYDYTLVADSIIGLFSDDDYVYLGTEMIEAAEIIVISVDGAGDITYVSEWPELA